MQAVAADTNKNTQNNYAKTPNIMEIKIENLKKCFGEKVAVNISEFTIHDGEVLGLVGNNGAGKSTLFRLMLDLIKADEGRVLMGDTDVSQTEEWKDEDD